MRDFGSPYLCHPPGKRGCGRGRGHGQARTLLLMIKLQAQGSINLALAEVGKPHAAEKRKQITKKGGAQIADAEN